MRDGGDKGCFSRIQLFKFGDIFQQDHITQVLRFIRIGIRIYNGDVRSLKIAFLIIRIDFQGFFLLTRSNQFPNQTTKEIIL